MSPDPWIVMYTGGSDFSSQQVKANFLRLGADLIPYAKTGMVDCSAQTLNTDDQQTEKWHTGEALCKSQGVPQPYPQFWIYKPCLDSVSNK